MKKASKRAAVLVFAFAMVVCIACALAGCAQRQAPSSSAASDSFASVGEAASDAAPDVNDPVWILLIGNDTRYGIRDDVKKGDPAFSDTIMLMRVDPGENYVSILSIPRDSATDFDGKTGKLNEAYYWGGVGWLKEKVEDLTGVTIDYYFDTTFVNFVDMVDGVGGVTADVLAHIELPDELSGELVVVPEGENQLLDGVKALVYSRMRKHYVDQGEACRQYNARHLIASGLRKVASASPDERKAYADIIEAGCETNMEPATLNAYFDRFSENPDALSITMGTGPYVGSQDEQTGVWVAWGDREIYGSLVTAMRTQGNLQDIIPDPQLATAY